MSKITLDDLINRYAESHSEVLDDQAVYGNLNFALRNILHYLMQDYQDDDSGRHLAARMLAFQIYQLESISFDEWKY